LYTKKTEVLLLNKEGRQLFCVCVHCTLQRTFTHLMDCMTLSDGTDGLSRYVGTELRNSTPRNVREERRSHLNCGGSLKLRYHMCNLVSIVIITRR
jgi:hypothetical protein